MSRPARRPGGRGWGLALAGAMLATGPADAQQPPQASQPPFTLVPYPAALQPGEGSFPITRRTTIRLDGPAASPALRRLGDQARAIVLEVAGLSLAVRERGPLAGNVVLRLQAPVDTASEAYALRVTPDSVVVASAGPAGLFYGLQTLRQLITEEGRVPAVAIEDAPRFPWRGMHLDVGRHWFPVSFIRRYLDLLARYKLNTFHWHLTEDQGWRLQIRRYPRLTRVGAWRRETMVEKSFDPYVGDGRRYGGYYTQQQVREIVRYAAERHITIVPEIEMPGHSVAALAAYPELACTSGPFEVATRWGVFDDVYCPSEATFTFLENVLREVIGLFPGPYVHIGGDEVPKRRWRESPLAQEIIRRERLSSEDELQSWFIRRIERFLSAHGRALVGWDEILEGGLPPRATVMSWRGTAGGIAAARAGHDVVMSPTSHLYFDYYQGDPTFEPLAIGGLLPLERVYSFEPVPEELTPDEARHILGAQGNVWTEYLSTPAMVEYMAVPRMLALAEVAWSPRERRDWSGFVARLPSRLRELDRLSVNYRVPHVAGLEEDRLTLADKVTIALQTALPNAEIRYTTDGSDPTPASTLFAQPFALPLTEQGVVVTARAFLPGGRASPPRAARFARSRLREPAVVNRETLVAGLRVTLLEGRLTRVAELDTLRPLRDTLAPDVSIPDYAPAENFALRFTGYVRVPADGIWRFRLTSDDGSMLWIGDTKVVDNDGLHGPEEKTGLVGLRAGYHPIRIGYFQRGGGKALRARVERDDGAVVPSEFATLLREP